MSMYNKIFTKILDSSIWLEPDATRLVWLTLIAAMDEDGMCQFASVANLAHRARVTIEDAAKAVAALEGPDENSSDPENEGRRIERVPGGWIVLNAKKYREMVTRTVIKEQTRARVARHRAAKRTGNESNGEKRKRNAEKRNCNDAVTQSDSDSKASFSAHAVFMKLWCDEYPNHHAGEKYVVNGGKDGENLKRLLESIGDKPVEDIFKFAVLAWKHGGFNCKFAATITGFSTKFNEIRNELLALKTPPPKDERPAAFRVPMNAPPTRPDGV